MPYFNPQNTIIIISSDEPIGSEGNIHQHYFDILSQQFAVIFVLPPKKWKLNNLIKKPLISSNGKARVFQYLNYLPASILSKITVPLNDKWNSRAILKLIPLGKKIVVWKFDSFRMINISPIKSTMAIYHVADPYFERFSDYKLAKTANLIVTVNKAFLPRYKLLNKNVMFVPHGIRIEDTIANIPDVRNIQLRFGNFFLMAGSINHDLDFQLLIKIARSFRSYNLLVVGKNVLTDPQKQSEFQEFTNEKNVKIVGAVNYHDLKNYIASCQICLVTYETTRRGFFRNPIKITNYLAQCKPIVNTVDIEELKNLQDRILFTTHDHREFIDLINDLIRQKFKVDEKFVYDYIIRNDYQKLVKQILDAAASTMNRTFL